MYFGTGWKRFRIAHMVTSDEIRVEMFKFQEITYKKVNFNPFKLGSFLFCIQDPDVEGMVNKIVKNGDKQRMPIREYYPNEKPLSYVLC